MLFRTEGAGKGGVTRGRGDAALHFSDDHQRDTDFAVDSLPTARFAEPSSEKIGVTLGSPTVAPIASAPSSAGVGASAGAPEAGRRIAPRHREAVRSFFQRPTTPIPTPTKAAGPTDH